MTEQMKDAPSDTEKLSGGGAAKTSSTVKVAQHSAASISANERVELVLFGVLPMIFVGR